MPTKTVYVTITKTAHGRDAGPIQSVRTRLQPDAVPARDRASHKGRDTDRVAVRLWQPDGVQDAVQDRDREPLPAGDAITDRVRHSLMSTKTVFATTLPPPP